jgi:hypothetical protein
MLLKKLYRALRYQYLAHKFDGLSPLKPNRAACEITINELQSSFFQSYAPVIGASTFLHTYFPTIDAYTLALKELARQVKEERAIQPDWLTTPSQTVSVDRFLISGDGFYQDPVRAIEEFRQAGINLCQSMKESDTEEVGVYEHNLRMLTKLFINLRLVAWDLIKVSLTNQVA